MTKRRTAVPKPKGSPAQKEAERAETALKNTREGYGGSQNDRTAGNQSGVGSQGGARDMTSGKRSGNQ